MKTHKRPNKFIELFLNKLVENKLSVEFEDVAKLEKFTEQLRFEFMKEESQLDLKLDSYRLIYELDIVSKSIVSTGCFVKPYHAIKSEYFNVIMDNLESLKKCFRQFSVFDVDSDLYLCWRGNNFFDLGKFEGCSYFYHNSGSEYSNRIFFDEEYQNYYDLCSLDQELLNENYLLYYSSFIVSNNLPVKHGFAVKINENTLNTGWERYHNYDRFLSYIKFLNDNFYDTIISVQLSSLHPELFSFEFQLDVDQYDSIVSKLIEYDCVPDDLKDNLLSVKFPEFIEYFVIKFKWQSSNDFGIKLYAHTENRDAIRSIFGVDDL